MEFLAHAHAVVLTGEAETAHAVAVLLLAEGTAHLSAGAAVFDGVADDVLADLAQIEGVAGEVVVRQQKLRLRQHHAGRLRLLPRQQQHVAQLRRQAEGRLRFQRRLFLRAVQRQHVVHQLQKVAGGGLRLAAALLDLCAVVRLPPDDLQHTHDDVDGGADVVAHAAEEAGFRLIRCGGAAHLLLQTVLVVLLATLALLRGAEHQQRRKDRRQRVDAEGGDHHVLALLEHVFIGEEHVQAVLMVLLPGTEKRTVRMELGQLAAHGGGGLQRMDEGHLVHRQVPLLRHAAAHHALAVGDVGVDLVIEQRLVARQQALDGRTIGGDDRARLEADAEDDAGTLDARHGCYVVHRAVTGQAAGEDLLRVVHDGADRLVGVVIAPIHVRAGAELDLQILVQHQHAAYALTLGVPRQLLVGAVLPHQTLAIRHLLRLLRQPHEAL